MKFETTGSFPGPQISLNDIRIVVGIYFLLLTTLGIELCNPKFFDRREYRKHTSRRKRVAIAVKAIDY